MPKNEGRDADFGKLEQLLHIYWNRNVSKSTNKGMSMSIIKSFLIVPILFIMFANNVEATVYYVDATQGSDAGSGTSHSEAWKTIHKVNNATFSPGDQILFQRGEIWFEMLIVPSSGAINNPIVFGAYGSGDNPIICGSDHISNWNHVTGDVWSADITIEPRILYSGDNKLEKQEGVLDNLSPNTWDWDNRVLYINNNGNPLDSIYAGQRSKCIYLNEKSHITIENLECRHANTAWEGSLFAYPRGEHIIVDHCIFRGSAYRGIMVKSVNHVEIKNCLITDCDGVWDAVKICSDEEGASNFLFSDNTIDHAKGSGITVSEYDDGFICNNQIHNCGGYGILLQPGIRDSIDNHQIFNNLIHDVALTNIIMPPSYKAECSGISIGTGTGKRHTNAKIYENVIYNVKQPTGYDGNGIIVDFGADGAEVYNNHIYDCEGSGVLFVGANNGFCHNNIISGCGGGSLGNRAGLGVGQSHSVNNRFYNNTLFNNRRGIRIASSSVRHSFKNNIVVDSEEVQVDVGVGCDLSADYNLYFDTGTQNSGHFSWKGSTANTLSEWHILSQQDDHSIEANPSFALSYPKNASDFKLRPNSPAVNTGINVGIETDFEYSQIPAGKVPDIGAYEYHSGGNPKSPKNVRISEIIEGQ